MASSTTTVKRDPYADLPRVPDFPVESSVVADGETMAMAQRGGTFGRDGQDTSPDLTWSEFPNETQSFIVTMYDPDGTNTQRVLALGGHQHSCVRHVAVSRSRRRGPDIARRINAFG